MDPFEELFIDIGKDYMTDFEKELLEDEIMEGVDLDV